MVRLRLFTAIVFAFYLFSGCTHTYVFPSYQSANFPQTKRKGSKWLVHVSPNVSVNALVKTFEKVYVDKYAFSEEFGYQLVDSLKSLNLASIHSSKSINRVELEKQILSKKLNKSTILPNDSLGPNYVVYISGLTVSSYFRQVYNGMNTNSSSIEVCVVNFKFDLIDPSTNALLTSFTSEGQCSVTFFDYSNILQQSVKKAINHAMAYLKTGKTDYTELY